MYKEPFIISDNNKDYIRDEELNTKILSYLNQKKLNESQLLSFISDYEIKRGIICEFTSPELLLLDRINFDFNNKVYETLFDDEGIDLLYQSNYANKIIELIIKNNYSFKKFSDNPKFCKAILDFSYSYDYVFYRIKENDSKTLFKVLVNNAKKYKNKIISCFLSLSSKIQIELIKNMDVTNEEIAFMISSIHNETAYWLMKNNKLDLSLLNDDKLIRFLSRRLDIPSFIINSKNFKNKLVNNPDIIQTRRILNLIQYLDIDNIVNKRKDYYDKQLYSYDKESGLLIPFKNILDNIKEGKLSKELIVDIFGGFNCFYIQRIFNELSKYSSVGIQQLVLKNFSNRYISDMIIDYHFEEFSYNIFLDIKELLLFNKTSDKKLSKEKTKLYEKILKIDTLSYDEKIELHEELKKYNVKEMFYDDMLFARNIIADTIKESILTEEKLQKYLNKEKSEKYGVNVYELNGEEFFAIVKSGNHYWHSYPYGYSYSLVGKYAIGVFGIESKGDTFVYDGIESNQLIHIFPADSYTHYDDDIPSTKRVNVLMNPNELLKTTDTFNELLIKEKGLEEGEFDNKIPMLRKIAVYCYNSINNEHLSSAKENDVGILLINTKNYYSGMFRDDLRGFPHGDYNYFRGEEILIGEFEENRDRFTRI